MIPEGPCRHRAPRPHGPLASWSGPARPGPSPRTGKGCNHLTTVGPYLSQCAPQHPAQPHGTPGIHQPGLLEGTGHPRPPPYVLSSQVWQTRRTRGAGGSHEERKAWRAPGALAALCQAGRTGGSTALTLNLFPAHTTPRTPKHAPQKLPVSTAKYTSHLPPESTPLSHENKTGDK